MKQLVLGIQELHYEHRRSFTEVQTQFCATGPLATGDHQPQSRRAPSGFVSAVRSPVRVPIPVPCAEPREGAIRRGFSRECCIPLPSAARSWGRTSGLCKPRCVSARLTSTQRLAGAVVILTPPGKLFQQTYRALIKRRVLTYIPSVLSQNSCLQSLDLYVKLHLHCR